jgi:hypothetical protein
MWVVFTNRSEPHPESHASRKLSIRLRIAANNLQGQGYLGQSIKLLHGGFTGNTPGEGGSEVWTTSHILHMML